ncbi:MAG: TIGR04255 family protein [Nitrosomonadales bacterium]|nr:TIGR04255 family protein [Nitrosomonadales bacterium]
MFKIDLSESFPLLSRAPIVEAAIGVTARAEAEWDEHVVSEQFKQRLSEYPAVQSQHSIRHEIKFGVDVQSEQAVHEVGWRGLRCESADKLHIAQFNRDGFSFSRLKPYQGWEQFQQEGFRLWRLYSEIAQPSEIQRIGLRFINRIEFLQDEVKLEDFLENPPKTPRDMEVPFEGFLHHNTLAVPGYPYGINLIQTVQPPQGSDAWGVILDIDVVTIEPIANQDTFEQHLAQMRWLKNKVFFGSVTPNTLELIK